MIKSGNLKYVIFKSNYDYWDIALDDLVGDDNVIFGNSIGNAALKYINILHTTNRINRYIPLPFQNIWHKAYVGNKISVNDNVIFIFFDSNRLAHLYGYLKYLKNIYKNSKCILFYANPLSKIRIKYLAKEKRIYDAIITSDPSDAEKYKLGYYGGLCSKIEIEADNEVASDVFFVGKNKGRIDQIHKIFRFLNDASIKTDFYITEVPAGKQLYPDKIKYNQRIGYNEVLKHIVNTKCILELQQKNQTGMTLRTCEALLYGKKLITNNESLSNTDYYNPEQISIINSTEDITTEFVFQELLPDKCKKYEYSLSPYRFLEYILEVVYLKDGKVGKEVRRNV